MKKITFFLMVLLASQAQATEPSQAALNKVCEASLISDDAARQVARQHKVTKAQRDRLVCNELPMQEFAQNYRATMGLPAGHSEEASILVNIQ